MSWCFKKKLLKKKNRRYILWFSFHFTRYLYDVSLLPTLQVNTEKYILVVNVSYRTQRCASIVSNALDKQPLARFHIYHSAWIIYHGLVIGRTEVPLLAHSILRRDLDRIPKTIKHLYNLPLYIFDSPLSLHHCSSNGASATSFLPLQTIVDSVIAFYLPTFFHKHRRCIHRLVYWPGRRTGRRPGPHALPVTPSRRTGRRRRV